MSDLVVRGASRVYTLADGPKDRARVGAEMGALGAREGWSMVIRGGRIAWAGPDEALRGSDAIGDWPILNALVNTAAGATWVSVHHGGGVGIGYSLHAGMVVVADGTDGAARRLARVLTSDPGMGVVRHVDAGYDEATAFAREHGVRVPGRTFLEDGR